MSANTTPIFVGQPDFQFGTTDGNGGATGPLKTQNTAYDGTGTVLTVFTADATNGGVVRRVVFRAAGTNVVTVARIFVNNGSTNATASNNVLVGELTLNATTASTTAATPPYTWVPEDAILALNAGYKINVVIATTVAAGYYVSTQGGKYTL